MISESPTIIEDFVSTFQTQQIPNLTQETQLSILLEVLGGIPEEVSHVESHFSFHLSFNWISWHSISHQSEVIFASVQRVTIRNEVAKRTQFAVSIIEQFIRSKVDHELTDDDLSLLLKAVKCAEAWLKLVSIVSFSVVYCHFNFIWLHFAEMVFHWINAMRLLVYC